MTESPATSVAPPPGQPPAPPAAPPGQPPGPGRGKPPVALVIVIVAVLLGCCCVVASSALFVACSAGGSGIQEQDWVLSDDQRLVVRDFGPPQGYTIVYSAPASSAGTGTSAPEAGAIVRSEVWDYFDAGSQFTFSDGVLTARKALPALKGEVVYADVRPEEFDVGMSVDDITQVLGFEPDLSTDVSVEEFEDLKSYGWNGQVVALMQKDRLVSVQVIPLPKGGQ